MPINIAGAAVAVPAISDDLGTDAVALQGVVNGFNIALTGAVLVWGKLASRLGSRRSFVAGLMIVAIASALSTVSVNLWMLDLARVVAGIGAGAIAIGGTTILSQSYSGAQRTRVFTLLGTIVGVGLAAGPTFSGLLISGLGWRGVFGVTAVLSVLALVATAFATLPASEPPTHAQGGKVLDLSPLKYPRFVALVLVPVAGSIAFVSVLTYLPVALSAVHDIGSAGAGMVMLPLTLPVLVAPMVAGFFVARLPRVTSAEVITASLIMLVIGGVLFFLLSPDVPVALLIVPMLLLGFGWGLPLGLVDGEALGSVPHDKAAAAAGLLNFLRLGSEAVAVAAFGAAMSTVLVTKLGTSELAASVAAGSTGHADAYASAFHMVILVTSIVTLLIGIVVVTLGRRREPALAGQSVSIDGQEPVVTESTS
ncbi:MFS transporter [Rhodococcus fascians]|nr:MFS transporter [Rhodococcus fascians]MBY3810429.1 MFS transporter [Rhodococcus fascians]MBY3841948.1 MFS transporter [Rhodococcus fascians]MBY3844399.1 MFS transporter [Rhodococcus fascians]MBY3850345.1 MFS transporter [Rhodococcus fascians]